MKREELIEEIERQGQFSFSRSSGPGGQNVNKVNSRVQLTLDLYELSVLSSVEFSRITAALSGNQHLQQGHILQIQAQSTRSQLENRKIAVQRMSDLIMNAAKPDKPRKKTAPSRAAKQRRIDNKRAHSRKKVLRRPVSTD